MLISINWIRDYVDLPAKLDLHELHERFTTTSAEVEEIRPIEVGARGLIAAKVVQLTELPGTRNLRGVTLDIGGGKSVETVSAAPTLHVGGNVVYAPPGAKLAALGDISEGKVAGRTSVGLIPPGEALGVPMALQEALFPAASVAPGTALPPEWFDDILIEVDNKAITHRPDLWGHYGIAREVAAIYRAELKPCPMAPLAELTADALAPMALHVADGKACRRYSGLRLDGVNAAPAPLWMQLRLGHIGLRPISGLVDLTNYIMCDLGQPMHAFDAAKVDQIEVDFARDGQSFRTLDGVERPIGRTTLMIQCRGHNVALAGIMGGLESEVSAATTSLLLESANFDPATIRKAAIALGLRTDASARFEKALDPVNTVLSIQRFVHLARSMYPNLRPAGRLTDAFPAPYTPVSVRVTPRHVARTVGKTLSVTEASDILKPLGFTVRGDGEAWQVDVPSFRATTDVTIEEDVIEEIARYVGYGTIAADMPMVTVRRFEPNALHQLEQDVLRHFTACERFVEIHGYLWYAQGWMDKLQAPPGDCVTLKNPAAEGCEKLRRTLMPGLLAAVEKNRFHFPAFSLIEVGSVFAPHEKGDREYRHAGLVVAQRGRKLDDELFARLKGAIERFVWQRYGRPVSFAAGRADGVRPWEDAARTAIIRTADREIGRMSVLDAALRRRIDEHLGAWAVAWAEVDLSTLVGVTRVTERLGVIPPFPQVELDFSLLVPRAARYEEVAHRLGELKHDLLRKLSFVTAYEGSSIPADRRSLTVRAVIGHGERTLIDADTAGFRQAVEAHARSCGYEIRG